MYFIHRFVNRSGFIASSIPETKSSAYNTPLHRVAPVRDAFIGRHVTVLNRFVLPKFMYVSLNDTLSIFVPGNIFLQLYS